MIIIATAGVCLMTYGSCWAAAKVSVWLALSETGGAHLEAAQALRAEVERVQPGRIDWRVAQWSEFTRPVPEPEWVVTVGTTAQRGMQDLFARDATPPPMLSMLVPFLAFERMADPVRVRARSISAVFVDQPPERQMELVRLALPGIRNVGMLFSAEFKTLASALDRAAAERGLQLVALPVEPGGLFPALQSLLPDVEVVLAQPDPLVFNSQTAGNILMAAYRRKVPLIGFSPAYVKAGAMLALYSTPAQIGRRGGELLNQALSGGLLSHPQGPREFTVSVNPDVARSLGFVLDEAQLGERLRQKDRP
ncbi:MAG: ABC transporter substrate binding protein [Sulfuritalea sp.]|nr:ABC transporter substrate binding protein [Sulfuritalea sp.]